MDLNTGVRRFVPSCLVMGTVVVTGLNAQATRLALGGGVTVPAGDYGSADKSGWHVLGVALVPIPTPHLALRFDAMYSHTSHTGFASGHTTLGGGIASAVWRLRREGPNLRPYLLMGLGFYDVRSSTGGSGSTSKAGVAWGGGGGVSLFRVGPAFAFLEARYITIRTSGGATNLFPVSAGVFLGRR